MRYKILDGQTVVNRIRADAAFMLAHYPAGNYREVADTPPPYASRPMSVLDFRNRFTYAEKVAIYTAAQSSIPLKVWLDDLAAAREVDVGHQQTIDGVNALVAAGLIVSARAAEILT